MFTGIVTHQAKVKARADSSADTRSDTSAEVTRLTIENPFERTGGTGSTDSIVSGESIAINGCCLTVLPESNESNDSRDSIEFFVSTETLHRTALGQIKIGDTVNLERSLKVGDRLGGHQVSGHIDAVGRLAGICDEGESKLLEFCYPARFARLLVEKGSIAISGVSLTVNSLRDEVDDSGQRRLTVMVIPHTSQHTTLGALSVGDEVNLEFDMAAKYALRASELDGESPAQLPQGERASVCSETQTLLK